VAPKPKAGLPDVFAKPGDAPVRGTPIEDLPPTSETTAVSDEQGATPVTAMAGEPASSPAPEMAQVTGAHTQAPPIPPTGHAGSSRQGTATLVFASVALVVSLTAPFWEGTVLASVGINTPAMTMSEQVAVVLARQDAKLAGAEQRLAAATAQVDAIKGAVATATVRTQEVTAQARSLAMLRLADALQGSRPFAAELATLHATGDVSDDLKPMLTALEPYAATGIPTLGQLQQDFLALYDGVSRVTRQSAQTSWLDLISWTGLSGLPEAARTNPTLVALSTGLSRLAAQDIDGAIEQASLVGGNFQASFADWIADAKARVAANRTLRKVEELASKPITPLRSP
jgi:hypothetical protein